MTTAGPAIETHGLTKVFAGGRIPALSDLDLRVERGEVFGFLGPNGAGKSTTIRLLLDLVRPTGGSSRMLGLDARRDGVRLGRRVGYLRGGPAPGHRGDGGRDARLAGAPSGRGRSGDPRRAVRAAGGAARPAAETALEGRAAVPSLVGSSPLQNGARGVGVVVVLLAAAAALVAGALLVERRDLRTS